MRVKNLYMRNDYATIHYFGAARVGSGMPGRRGQSESRIAGRAGSYVVGFRYARVPR